MKTRFCPSPTGAMHLGNARTALFNALLARAKNGTFLLRIEDTDKTRSSHTHTEQLQADLRWLGLEWQEGPGVGGPQAPYWQSERQDIYDQFYEALQKKHRAYYCFCTELQLSITRKAQMASGQPPRYPGTCMHLSPEEIQTKLDAGLVPVLRFHMPKGEEIIFEDAIRGMQRFRSDDIGDFIIRRADGTAPFMYANAIDDALMGVTHVLRGEDHLANTPRQIMILKALELPVPAYIHISLIMGPDGTPLSKRHGSQSVSELHQAGYFPEAVLNYLARLGHYYESNAFMSFEELASAFSVDHLNSAAARFDQAQLYYWQQQALLHLNDELFWEWLTGATQTRVPENLKHTFMNTIRSNITFPQDAERWATIFFEDLEYDDAQKSQFRETGKPFFLAALAALETQGIDYAAFCDAIKTQTGVKGKALFMPLRLMLTAETAGPELAQIFLLLGVPRIKQRLQQICDFLN